jgi:hypothetical protein
MTDEEYNAYISNAKDKSIETGLPIVRQDSVMAPAYKPPEQSSALPAIGGIVGGIMGGFLAKSPVGVRAGATAGEAVGAFGASLLPSLIGSSAGTAIGTGAERLMKGDLFSAEGGKAMASNLIENAAWDVGGNLVFSLGGKAIRLGKEQVKAFRNPTGMMSPEQEARTAAQKWLAERGSTLSLGQATDSVGLKTVESIVGGGTGAGVLAKQREGVTTAVQQGLDDVKSVLNTSTAFKQALLTNDPLNKATGTTVQDALTIARGEFKDAHRPFYESLTKDTGVYADFRNIKRQAQVEVERIGKSKNIANTGDRLEVLKDILKQDDFVDFGVAHDVRSSLYGAANDLAIPGKAATSKQAAYTKYASEVESSMDKAMQLGATTRGQAQNLEKQGLNYVEQPGGMDATTLSTGNSFNPGQVNTAVSKDLIKKYDETRKAYKAGMDGLYGETISTAAGMAPSKVGSYLADLTESEKFGELYKAIAQIDKYAPKGSEKSAAMLGDIKYSFLEKTLSTPDKALSFSKKISSDPDLARSFYKLFASEGASIKQLLNAADIGLADKTSMATFLKSRYTGASIQGTAAIAGYVGMPDEVKERLKDKLPEALLTAGALVLTPRMIAKIATNPDTVSAFIKLAKHKEGTKMSGAVAAKLAAQLNSAGVIDNEYITSMQEVFHSPKEPVKIDQPFTASDYDQLYQNAKP